MPKYCPNCQSEFQNSIKVCPKDKVALLDKAPKEKFTHFVPVYAASSEVERERIIAFLEKDGIKTGEPPAGISQIPVASELHFVIAVDAKHQDDARKKIKHAQEDGIIPSLGVFLREPKV